MPLRQSAERIVAILRDAGHEALFAGGCVRDMVLGCEPKDYDVATDAPPERVMSIFRRTKRVGAKFGVVMVRMGGHEIEVATFREESTYSDHRRPDKVKFTTAEADAKRRDFTINGMFYDPVQNRVIDYVGGRDDLTARLIRAIGDPQQRFDEDHLRMLRAVRFAARFDFEIEPDTFAAIQSNAAGIETISAERIRMELEQVVRDPNRVRGWRLLHDGGLLNHLVPGWSWFAEEAEAVKRRFDALPEQISFTLALAAMLRDRSPGEARDFCISLRCSSYEVHSVVWILSRLPEAEHAATLHLAGIKALMADERFTELTALLRADRIARGASLVPHDTLVQRAASIPAAEVSPPPFITGDDLIAMGAVPGPRFGAILERVYRAQRNNALPDREAALAMARNLLSESD